jgi:hypothetical protein
VIDIVSITSEVVIAMAALAIIIIITASIIIIIIVVVVVVIVVIVIVVVAFAVRTISGSGTREAGSLVRAHPETALGRRTVHHAIS